MAIVLRVLAFCCSFGEVEFHQKVIGAIVNLPIPKWRTIMGLFLLEKGYLYQNGVEFHQKVIGALSTCLYLHGEH